MFRARLSVGGEGGEREGGEGVKHLGGLHFGCAKGGRGRRSCVHNKLGLAMTSCIIQSNLSSRTPVLYRHLSITGTSIGPRETTICVNSTDTALLWTAYLVRNGPKFMQSYNL